MSRERELLIHALGALERTNTDFGLVGSDINLMIDIRAELEKPEPVECGTLKIDTGCRYFDCYREALPDGKYRLLAEKIDE